GEALFDEVPVVPAYQARILIEGAHRLGGGQHGGRFALSWAPCVSDHLHGLRGLPERLAVSARRSEDYHATSLFTTATGPLALTDFWGAPRAGTPGAYNNLYLAAHTESAEDHPQLTVDSLSAGLTAIQT